MRACLYACALLLPALAAAPASAQLVLQLDLSPDRVNAGGSVSAVLCRTLEPTGSCPARDVEGTAYGIDAMFRLRGESDRGGEVFSGVIAISAVESTSTRAVSLGPLPAGIWSFSLANVDETPLGNSIMLSAPPQLISFAPVTQVQLEVLQPEVAAGEAVRLRLVPDGVYDRARAFVVRGSNNFGAEAFLPVVEISADEGVAERSFTSLPAGLWSFFLTENLVGANTQTISVLGMPQVRVGFPAIIVEGPAAPGVFASDGISYASLSDSVVLRVSTSTPPRRQVTLMLQGESSSGEFTDVQPVTLNPGGSPGTVSFSIPGEGLWTFGIVQQDPADTAYPAAPSAFAIVQVGLPTLRLSGYDSGGSGQNVQLRLSSPLAVTGEFMVEGVKGDSSMRNLVSFTQELQKDINLGRLDGGRWSFRVIDSSPTGAANLLRAEREVLIEGDMRYATRFQPEHANAVRYDSARNRFFALAGTRATAQWFTPNGSPGSGDGFCISGLSVRILRASSIIATNFIGNRPSSFFSFERETCPGDNDMADLDVTFAAEGGGAVRYRFDTANVLGEGLSRLQNPREVYAEPLPSAESFSPSQDVIEVTETAVLNLQLREPALVDSRFTVRAQDLSVAGSSARFNTIALLRGESSASVSFRNMERGVWSFTLVQASPPQLQTPQLLATVPARVAAGSIFVRIEAPARVAGGEVVLRLVPDISLQVDATFTVTATGMTAGGLMLASMMQQVHLPAGMPSAEATFSGLSPGSWVFGITGVEPENPRLDLSSTAAVTTGDLRAQLRVADPDRRVQAGRDVIILLELPQALDGDAVFTVRAEGPEGMSRDVPVTLGSGVSAESAVFANLMPGRWQFTVSTSVEQVETEGVMVTVDIVSRSALDLRVQGVRDAAGIGNLLLSALAVQLRITATPPAIDDATLTLRAVSGITSQMITVTLLADTATVTADFGMLPDGVWRFSVAETVPDDLFDAAAEVEAEIRTPRGVLSAGRTIVRGSIDLPLTVVFDIPAGSAASDNFPNRLIAVSPAGVETSRTDSFGAVPSSMVYSFGSDAGAADHAFAGVDRTDGIWTFRHECSAARVICGEVGVLRVRVGDPPDASLSSVSSQILAGRPVPISLRLTGETVGDLRLTVLAQESGTEESTSAVIVLPGDQSVLDFNFPPLSAGTWVFGLSTQTEHVNPRAGDADGAATELVRRDSLASARTQVTVQLPVASLGAEPLETVRGAAVTLTLGVTAAPMQDTEFSIVGSIEDTVQTEPPLALTLPAGMNTATLSYRPQEAGEWIFQVTAAVPENTVDISAAQAPPVTVRLPVASLGAGPLETVRGAAVTLTLRVTEALMENTEFSITGSIGDAVQTEPPLALTLPAGMNTATLSYRPQEAGEWIFQVTAAVPENTVDISAAQAPPVTVRLPVASLGAEPLETVRGAAVTLTLRVTEALMENTEFSITGSIGDAVQTEPPLALTLPAGMNTATLSYRPQEAGEWIFQVTAAVPENTVDISAAQAPPVTVRLPSLRTAELQSTAAQGAAVRVGIETDLPLLSTVMVTVQALRRGAPPLVRETMVLLQIQERAGSAGEAEFGPGELLSGDWDITLAAVQPAGRAEVDSSASAAVAVAAPQLRLSAAQQFVQIGAAVQLRVRAEGSDGMEAAPDTTVTVTVEGVCSCGGTTTTLTQAITLSAAAALGEAEFAGEQLQLGVWQFAARAVPAGFLDLSETRPVTVTAVSELVLPVTLMVSPSTPATAVRGELVVLSIEAVDSTIRHGGFSAQVLAVVPDDSTQQLSVPVAAGQSIGTHSFVPARSGLWQFTLDSEVAAESSGLLLDNRSGTLTLMVEDAQLDVSAPPGIDADDLVLALRYLELCLTPAQGCPDIEDSLRLNLGQGAGPILLTSLRLPEVAGDGVDRGQADIVMLLDYLSGVRGNALFPPGAPVEFREVRLEIIEELLDR